ncbi:4-alpha-glucanotransferase, partial [Neisseria meningitidis]|uniref:4-alpha-glucanotransferase n=1 Tax=Neisseria meningitidis TaxID=487 RepID=UPI0018C3C3D4
VPDRVCDLLNRYQVFSYKVLYFSKGRHGFELPDEYPEQEITVVSTHDVAPLAGYWTGKDLDWMFRLGTIPDEETFQTALEALEHDKAD